MKKQTAALVILLIVAMMECVIAQKIHQLPFASSGNTIELTVANTATMPLAGVKIIATDVPAWVKFATAEQHIALIKREQEIAATFTFAVDKIAPVGKSHTLKFVIIGPKGERWQKDIMIVVAAPEKFEVFQNYPNPFNPSTTISYDLPIASDVTLKIFDVLGQVVATLVDERKEAGYHQVRWSANLSTGVYFYRLQAGEFVETKKMILLH